MTRGTVKTTSKLVGGMAAALLAFAAPAEAAFMDWWLTPDQQGRIAYAQGDYAGAARLFTQPMWKGLAFYAAGEFASAAAIFENLDTPESLFQLGNSRAHQGQLSKSVAAYRAALERRPDFPEARFNLDWVQGLLELQEREYDDYGGTGGKLGADGVVYDDRARNAQQTMTEIQARSQGLSEEQLREIWMRRVQTSPGDFLELKFAYQLQQGED